MLEDVAFNIIDSLSHSPRRDKDGEIVWDYDIPEEEREGKYFDKYGAEVYLPEDFIKRYNLHWGDTGKNAIGRKLLKKTLREPKFSAGMRGVKSIEYPAGTLITEDVYNDFMTDKDDYQRMGMLETYPADIPDEEVEKKVRKALKYKQMDDAIHKAFEQQKNILKGIDGNIGDDDDD